MKLMKQYLEEINTGRNVEYTDNWFVMYAIIDDECFIEELYIKPECRGLKLTHEIIGNVEHIAKNMGCRYLTSTCKKDRSNAISFQLNNGFILQKIHNDTYYFSKELL